MIKLVKANLDIILAFLFALGYTIDQFASEHWHSTTTLKLKITGAFMVFCYSFITMYMIMYVALLIGFWIFRKR
ncbi:hypothetical protein EAH77_15945 [Ewingella americana]|uniref:Uncharacterized protein n=1 Tax=Ewingella americana TaxID=41202 RepID=A0A502GEU7_9GAMM|nr:hypothetical protein EAH77_15945 [Ewingella americana]